MSTYFKITLYFKYGRFKIRIEEMTHNVEEAKEKALKTVERFTSKEINCLVF